MSRIAVVGPGSVGLFFAGHLAAAGHDVLACARRPFDRYRIESPESPLEFEANVATDPAEVDGPYPWVLLAVKAHQTAGAAGWLEAVCDTNTTVLVVQNGIEHDHAVPFANGATVVPTVVYCGAELIEPGYIEHLQAGHLFVPMGDHVDGLVELFSSSVAEVRPTEEFITEQWRKLSINVVVNGLTALTNRGIGAVSDEALAPVATELLRECWEVGRAAGADLDPAKAAALIAAIGKNSSEEAGTSMLYDTRAGKPTEHDAIHGAAIRAADHYGIDVARVRMLHGILEARSRPLR